jgi:hypothetical protein
MALAQGPKPTPVSHPPQTSESKVTEPPHEMTVADVHAFLDGFMPMQLEREDIAGAVVLVVKDGAIFFAKGYGYSDVEKKTPVTVDATLFRPGSVSKLFTWTAVMQLVEQGKLDLDRDINDYLDFKIPPKFGKPITLRNLMTHTPGFEEQIKDLIIEAPAPLATLRQHLITHIPERIFPPGTTPAYSNYGASLAGYIVERVSGQPFNDYMHARQFGLSPALNGMCLGFYEEMRNGHRIIGHGGDTIYFHSDMHLMLDSGVAFFVSYNSAGKGDISPRTALWEHFLDRYFPYTPPKVEKLASADADAHTVAGHYISSRRSESNFLKVAEVQGDTEVTPDQNGMIKVEPFKDFNGQLKKWQEIAPLVYRSVNGQDLIAFRHDEQGRMQLATNFPAVVEQRVSLTGSSVFNQTIIVAALIVLALTLVCWPIAAMIRAHYRQRLDLNVSYMRLRLWVPLVCAIDIVFLVLFLVVLSSDGLNALTSRNDFKFHAIQSLGVIGALGTVVVILACLRSWKDPQMWFWTRIWNLLLLLACIGFVWFSYHWNLLNFNMNY